MYMADIAMSLVGSSVSCHQLLIDTHAHCETCYYHGILLGHDRPNLMRVAVSYKGEVWYLLVILSVSHVHVAVE